MSRFFIFLILQLLITTSVSASFYPDIMVESKNLSKETIDYVSNSLTSIAKLVECQDGGEIERLRRRSYDAVISALAAKGYFSPKVNLDIGHNNQGVEKWNITIDSGKQATVSNLELNFLGRISHHDYVDRVKSVRDGWVIPLGHVFTNSEWSEAKKKLLNSIVSKDFLFARIMHSEARIDLEKSEVFLSITIDSGPLVLMGDIQTYGFHNIPSELVNNYIKYKKFEPFDQDLLNDWQQHLQSTNLFKVALVTIDTIAPDYFLKKIISDSDYLDKQSVFNSDGNSNVNSGLVDLVFQNKFEVILPVHVLVVELPLKKVVSSIGVDDGSGVKLESVYKQNVIRGMPIILSAGVGVDRGHQRLFMDLNLLPKINGKRNSFGVICDNFDNQGLKVTRFALGFTRSNYGYSSVYKNNNNVYYETNFGSLLAYDQIHIKNDSKFSLPTITNSFELSRNRIDNKYNPRSGNIIVIGLGAGLVLDTVNPYARVKFRSQYWWPLSNIGVITIRSEFGKIWPSDKKILIPDDFGFRVGGARSIRGYSYQSIGCQRGFATVGASMMTVASVEYSCYFTERWGAGFFVDVGDAFNSLDQMDLALGYGIGARVRTPAGPLSLDVAYGHKHNDLRLHFSLGIAF
ncbi:surface antigen [Candidatus Kinetoplastibacterium desouzaii TCC079E]|uniref:Surface antigen n=1 Tax=Candidatus Kinetoplastidibacterium desouzai TCC079E TaxID=1208919 RepID=M1M2Y5_9PROT|nr:BamA/TamA family outer membrane protein [Candidatus Kinetoplastibacterium desouzaii]AGF46645.1 surface antigen [Candidatus Kinetoplastibacterium desouzaii TCC079E]